MFQIDNGVVKVSSEWEDQKMGIIKNLRRWRPRAARPQT